MERIIRFQRRESERETGRRRLYGKVRSPRGREIDLAIAATAIARDAALWTLKESDFRDIPGLKLVAGESG